MMRDVAWLGPERAALTATAVDLLTAYVERDSTRYAQAWSRFEFDRDGTLRALVVLTSRALRAADNRDAALDRLHELAVDLELSMLGDST